MHLQLGLEMSCCCINAKNTEKRIVAVIAACVLFGFVFVELLLDQMLCVLLQVLEVLCSLCVCHGVAVRYNQNLICDNLLPERDLLLQTRLANLVTRYNLECFSLNNCLSLSPFFPILFRCFYDVIGVCNSLYTDIRHTIVTQRL